ncbi:hypothetical protein HNP55_003958 [Paucibacter oligotrophus]|uniref:Uncharacterized protein n=1 Tax=Roseateles oligotrophus TaxID=1769250 RepID=A0A840LGR3_9BURK|nr:hypothetical protein [Roseateles oligotrophus]
MLQLTQRMAPAIPAAEPPARPVWRCSCGQPSTDTNQQ